MNFAAYSAQVRERLRGRDFTELTAPDDLAPRLSVTLERSESWGRLILAVASQEASAEAPLREALLSAAAAWVRELRRGTGARTYLILVFPLDKKVDEETSVGIRALRQEGEEQEWGVIPWSADLEVELLDRHTGFPRVEDQVARVLTEVPRGAVEEVWRKATGPKIGNRGLLGNLGYVPVTRFILAATIGYYLWSIMMSGMGFNLIGSILGGPGVQTLVTWGANHGVLVIDMGQHWRLVTHMLLHGGIFHLGMNMWALWNLGRHVELVFGSRNMAFIYVVAGVAGGIASTVFRPYAITGVGASGAILGLLGALVYFALTLPGRQVDWRSLLTPLVVILMLGFFTRVIDNYAHIGGFLGGMLAAFVAGIPGQRHPWRTWAMIGTAAAVAIILSGLVPLPRISLFG